MIVVFAVVACGLVLWTVREELLERDVVEPDLVAWTSPIDDEYFEEHLPRGVESGDVWDALAWIGQLPEVARV